MLFCYCFVFSQNSITISSITINGNKVTKNDIILREVVIAINSSYPAADLEQKIKESKENLINLKLFNFVEISYTLTGDKAQLTIDVTERWYFGPILFSRFLSATLILGGKNLKPLIILIFLV